MANALTSQVADLQTNAIHQFLHGYSEGHRLIASSLKLPDDLARLMLRMSDLSGSSVVSGFEEYITGYPLASINAYALATTWYAAEMPRPGCVWTHTLVLPAPTIAAIPSLNALIHLFKRPKGSAIKGEYAETLSLNSGQPISRPDLHLHSDVSALGAILSAYYVSSRNAPVVLVARNSREFREPLFALWSQQWPRLRQQFAFCTGSLSARRLADRAFDIQCAPPALAKDVAREAAPDDLAEALVISEPDNLFSDDLQSALNDALIPTGGSFRQFLWSVADMTSRRSDFASYVKLFDAFYRQTDATALVGLIAAIFPEPTAGTTLKAELLEGLPAVPTSGEAQQKILRALATTDKYGSFNAALLNDELIARLFTSSRDSTRRLVSELFHSNLNPLGDQLLSKLVRTMDAEDARYIVNKNPQLLPAISRGNPSLAASPQVWLAAGDRKRELLDSLVAEEIPADLIRRIVFALLDSGSERFIHRAIERWGRDAVFAALDWTESHDGSMSEAGCQALSFQIPSVIDWLESGSRSTAALVATAHVIAPHCCEISHHDSTIWLRTFYALRETGRFDEVTYLQAFLLGLGLRNVPPVPLDLVAESFEAIYVKAESQQLRDDAWMILEPLVPELSWRKNWDKCERMRRALLLSFMRNSWPPWELKARIKDPRILGEVLDSVRKVRGENYFFNSRG